jgi:hypothetical protein
MNFKLVVLSVSLVLAGCQSTGNQNELQKENTNLKQRLQSAESEIGQLKGTNALLKRDIDSLNHVVSVLDTEKNSRVAESSLLREKVRFFVQNQTDVLKNFLVEGDLLDYIGGELVQRSMTEDKPRTIVDLNNRIKAAGVLTGVGAYVIKPSQVRVMVLREFDGELVVLWQSEVIKMANTGKSAIQFANSVSVEAGDYIAYRFVDVAGVGYDTGTGNTRYSDNEFVQGKTFPISSLLGEKDKRSYAIGVYGLLNQ